MMPKVKREMGFVQVLHTFNAGRHDGGRYYVGERRMAPEDRIEEWAGHGWVEDETERHATGELTPVKARVKPVDSAPSTTTTKEG